jgi:hypothetical protein
MFRTRPSNKTLRKALQKTSQDARQTAQLGAALNLGFLIALKRHHGGRMEVRPDPDLGLVTPGAHVTLLDAGEGRTVFSMAEPHPTLTSAFRWIWRRFAWAWVQNDGPILRELGARRWFWNLYILPPVDTTVKDGQDAVPMPEGQP